MLRPSYKFKYFTTQLQTSCGIVITFHGLVKNLSWPSFRYPTSLVVDLWWCNCKHDATQFNPVLTYLYCCRNGWHILVWQDVTIYGYGEWRGSSDEESSAPDYVYKFWTGWLSILGHHRFKFVPKAWWIRQR